MPDAGCDRSPGAAGRASRRDARIAWIFGIAMDQIGGEPAVRKRRAIGAPENHGAGLAQIVDHGAVGACDDIALQLQAVGGGEPFLIDIDLDGQRHARQRTDIFVARDRRIDGPGLRQYIGGPMLNHGVD